MTAIVKVTVSAGVHWIEVPSAGLRMLCGCPVDAVKHLLRRGLILPVTRDGTTYETGPNAILLSDLTLQNGAVCNCAEFPVLQMLYRQGMLVPGHPNNTGARPLLLGSREQVEAQMDYIFRGNYGLTSREELLATGLAPAQAEDVMRWKLAFAFGEISASSALLNAVPIEDAPVEIRDGVRVTRLRTNVFEVAAGGERVEVDLNLGRGVTYACPYTLEARLPQRQYFAIVHTGDGDGWDMHRPTTGSLVLFQDRTYLIDAGPHIDAALGALGIGIGEIDGIFHTHGHDDHLAGLTTLIRGDRRIPYYAAPMVRASVFKKLSALLQLPEAEFHELFDVRDLQLDAWNDIEGLEVQPTLSPHPVETTVLRFRAYWEGGHRVYAHLLDVASDKVMRDMIAPDEAPAGMSERAYEAVRAAYHEPATLKKIDIGGGMIHGEAADFRGDRSGKVLLAHTARPLTETERALGSGAPFGTIDVLIEGDSDLYRQRAADYLRGYFPRVPEHRIRHLLNCPIAVINPETLLIREGEFVKNVLLVVGGTVEMLSAAMPGSSRLWAGSMIGETPALLDVESAETYRATSFVRALVVPRDLYHDFVARNALYLSIVQARDKRDHLRRSRLLADGVTYPTFNRLVGAAEPVTLAPDLEFPMPAREVYVLESGSVQLEGADGYRRTLGAGDYFGAEVLAHDGSPLVMVRVTAGAQAYRLPFAELAGIPVVRWKLLETQQRRGARLRTA